jgi:hypothetical protein
MVNNSALNKTRALPENKEPIMKHGRIEIINDFCFLYKTIVKNTNGCIETEEVRIECTNNYCCIVGIHESMNREILTSFKNIYEPNRLERTPFIFDVIVMTILIHSILGIICALLYGLKKIYDIL